MPLDSDHEIVVATNLSETSKGAEIPALPPDPPRTRWFLRVLQLIVPAAVAIAMVSVLTGERARVDCDLQLQTNDEVRPGSTLPVRGLFYTGLQAIEGPRLSPTDATVEIVDAAGQPALRRAASHGLGGTVEATLPIDAAWRGPFKARLSVREGDSTVVAERSFTVTASPAAAVAQPRPLRPLQQLSAGPLRREGQATAPSALDLQVIGGACAPELPCELLVHVGEPAAAIGVETYGAVEVVTAPPSTASPDIVRFTVKTHGPEAELRLVATIDGQPVARRSFRLPIAQAMLPLETASVVAHDHGSIALRRASGEAPCIVDLFHDDEWTRSVSFARCDRMVIDGPLAPGLWRVQTRDDAFGGDAAATRLIVVRAKGESDAALLTVLARHVTTLHPDDLMARRLLERSSTIAARDPQAYATWLLAGLEDQLVALPTPVSSYPLALNALEQKRGRLRMFCLVALLLSAVAAVSLVARRGLHASARARDIMEDAGDPDAHSQARRTRMTLTVIASAASIAVAFLAIALYVIARG